MARNPNFPNLRKTLARCGAFALAMLIAACHPGGSNGSAIPGDRSDTRPYEGVAPGDTLRFTGTEPFWGGEVKGDRMIYKTPEKPDGEPVTVSRFNGRGGFSYSGTLGGAVFTMAITPGTCSDGMSDRSYPFVATLQRGQEMRTGCAWSDAHPFTGPQTP
jgi:uncharacterized membrane protein